MTMRFPYTRKAGKAPIVPLNGKLARPRPILSVTLVGPSGAMPQDALLDTGADDTVFSDRIAAKLGIDLSNAPVGKGAGFAGASSPLRFAQVTLRIADNNERHEWKAWVGFSATAPRFPMLGFAGFLQFFTATFHGDREEVELTVNGSYPGT